MIHLFQVRRRRTEVCRGRYQKEVLLRQPSRGALRSHGNTWIVPRQKSNHC